MMHPSEELQQDAVSLTRSGRRCSLAAVAALGHSRCAAVRDPSEGQSFVTARNSRSATFLSGFRSRNCRAAAELNRFPGPMHVLDLRDQLSLSAEQRENVRRLMERHKSEARVIGAKLVEAERALDRHFAGGSISADDLASQVKAIATLHGDYRLSHRETHRRMKAILTREQVDHYDALRGYTGAGSAGGHRGHH